MTADRPAPRGEAQRSRELYARYLATFATGAVEDIVRLHAVDGVFHLHTGTRPVAGREAIGAAFSEVFAAWPQLRAEPTRSLHGADFWVLDWIMHAVVQGREVSVACTDVATFDDDGLVLRKDTWVDLAELQRVMAEEPRGLR